MKITCNGELYYYDASGHVWQGEAELDNTVPCDDRTTRRVLSEVRKRKNLCESRKARTEAIESLGMKRVKGALGGTYYE